MRLLLLFIIFKDTIYTYNGIHQNMTEERPPTFTGVAIMGLFFIAAGIVMIFAFIITLTGNDLPEILEFKSESYSLLLIGLVNIAAAVGLLYRAKSMWSITMIFVAVIIVGDLMDLFFTGTTKIVIAILYLAVILYMMTNEVRVWYGMK